MAYISTRAQMFNLHYPVTTTPMPNPLSYPPINYRKQILQTKREISRA